MSSSSRSSRALLFLALAVLMTSCFAGVLKITSDAEAYSAISIQVDHPSYGAISTKVPIVVTARGGPAEDLGGNYTLSEITISATNSTGFDWNPKSPTNELGVFHINLTMPATANQTIKLTVNVTSIEWRGEQETYETSTFAIKVVSPVVIKAQIFNRGAVDAMNVTARFFVDGSLLKSQIFNLTAGNSANLTYNWTFASIRHGQHLIKVTIDEPNNVVEFSDGNNEMTQTIYFGAQGNPAGAVLTMVLIIMIVLFVLTYLQKPVRRAKKF